MKFKLNIQFLEREIYYLETKRKLFSGEGPQPPPHKPIAAADLPHHVNQQTDGVIRRVDREHVSSVGHEDPTPSARRQVYMVDAGAGGHNQPKRRQVAEEVGGDRASAEAEDGLRRLGVLAEEIFGWERRFVGFENVEPGRESVLVRSEEI